MMNTTSAAPASDPLTDWLPPAKPYTCGHVAEGICDGCLDARLRQTTPAPQITTPAPQITAEGRALVRKGSVQCDTDGCTNSVYRPGVYRKCVDCRYRPGSPDNSCDGE